MTLWQKPAVKRVAEQVGVVKERVFGQQLVEVTSYRLPRNPDIVAAAYSGIAVSSFDPVFLEYSKTRISGSTEAHIGEILHNVVSGYLHAYQNGVLFQAFGDPLSIVIEAGGGVLDLPVPEGSDNDVGRPVKGKSREEMTDEEKYAQWTLDVPTHGSFRFDYADLVEVALVRATKPPWLRFVRAHEYIRFGVLDRWGRTDAFSISFPLDYKLALPVTQLPAHFMQQRFRREVDYYIEPEFMKYSKWQPFARAVWDERARKIPTATLERINRYWEDVHADARTNGFSDATAVSIALEKLAPMLPEYRGHEVLRDVIADYEAIARGEKSYQWSGHPLAIRRGWDFDSAIQP